MIDLPAGWASARLADLGTWCGGGTPAKSRPEFWTGGSIPWVSPKDMKVHLIADAEDHITEAAVAASATNVIPAGSVLAVTRSGILRRTFPVAVTTAPVAVNQDLKALKPAEGIDPRYVAWLLRSSEQRILHECSKDGTTVDSIDFSSLVKYEVAIAPSDEQQRIVTAIEEQFSRLDAGATALARVRQNIGRLRAAVFQAAAEGRLTNSWRSNRHDVESADIMLRRLREKLAQAPRYHESSIDVVASDRLPALPSGWSYTRIKPLLSSDRPGMKTGPFGSLLKKHEHRSEGIPVVGIENIEPMHFIRGSRVHIGSSKAEDLSAYDVRPGDVLISRSGTVGEVCVAPPDLGTARFSTNVMRVVLNTEGMLPAFFALLFNGSPIVLSQVFDLCKGTTRAFLNQEILSAIIFPTPPLAEQCEIISLLDQRLSWIADFERQFFLTMRRLPALRESILRDAFSGKLVPQDPFSEPASALLERIAPDRVPSNGRRLTGVVKSRFIRGGEITA